MKRMPYEPPTEHYDDRIAAIDEQICQLIKERKDVSSNNPGFPKEELFSAWSEKYDLYEEFLKSVFGHFLNEDIYRPVEEPEGFLKNIPILKSFEKQDMFFSVTFISQFENASVVHFNIDKHEDDEDRMHREPTFFDLSIEGYDCRSEGGGGTRGHVSYTYIVSPPLPDDLSGIHFVFKEEKTPFRKKPNGLEFVIKGGKDD